MTVTVHSLVRHPIKAIGREELASVKFSASEWMPYDRKWAVAHERAKLESGWAKKINFLRGVAAPSLMAVEATLDTASKRVTLRHPETDDLTFKPDSPEGEAALIEWLRAIWPMDMPHPVSIYQNDQGKLTDVSDPWISINSLSSLAALSHRADAELSPHRFRGNIWLDGLKSWEEANWVGRRIRIGGAIFEVREQITRCKATMANPETGKRDVDMLDLLGELGHQEFGVYAEVVETGEVTVGDTASLL